MRGQHLLKIIEHEQEWPGLLQVVTDDLRYCSVGTAGSECLASAINQICMRDGGKVQRKQLRR